MITDHALLDVRVAITRPVGTGAALARRVRALGGMPLLLPGSSLHAQRDATQARADLGAALAADVTIFTSPAAVRFARRLDPLCARGTLVAPGAGTLRALRRAGCTAAVAPAREDSEGILGLPALRDVRGRRVAIVGAPGGRGLLDRELAGRGAGVIHAQVYERKPARLGRRHAGALLRDAGRPLYLLLSSGEALANILGQLPDDARSALLLGTAIASSDRLAAVARAAGFARVTRSESAHTGAFLAAVARDRAP